MKWLFHFYFATPSEWELCVKPHGGTILKIWGLGWIGSWVQPQNLECPPLMGIYPS